MARRFTRRRKQRGLWLPIVGTAQEDDGVPLACAIEGVIDVDGTSAGKSNEVSNFITFDQPIDTNFAATNTGTTMADFIGGGYRLRRLVGKLNLVHVSAGQGGELEGDQPAAANIGAGFMVRRVNPTGGPLINGDDAAPLLADNIRDPWIYRNTWILGNCTCINQVGSYAPNDAPSPTYGQAAVQEFPANNQNTFGQFNGPYFDVQTRRTVGLEERLIFNISTLALPLKDRGVEYTQNSQVYYHLDLRAFAFPARMTNRRNASR